MLLLFHYNYYSFGATAVEFLHNCCYDCDTKPLKTLSFGAKIYKKGKCENFFITKVFHLP